MEFLLEILKYALPSIFLLIMSYMLLTNFFENEEKKRVYSIRKAGRKEAMPLRLQATERMVLFLERITPNNLLVRIPGGGLTVEEYQSLLVKSIRQEFEYNLTQQVYLSEEGWSMVVAAKSSTIGLINKIAGDLEPRQPAIDLSKRMLTYALEMDNFPTRKAVAFLKREIRQEF
jgi:hypothetical protein